MKQKILEILRSKKETVAHPVAGTSLAQHVKSDKFEEIADEIMILIRGQRSMKLKTKQQERAIELLEKASGVAQDMRSEINEFLASLKKSSNPKCAKCGSDSRKNGMPRGYQQFKCKGCARNFLEHTNKPDPARRLLKITKNDMRKIAALAEDRRGTDVYNFDYDTHCISVVHSNGHASAGIVAHHSGIISVWRARNGQHAVANQDDILEVLAEYGFNREDVEFEDATYCRELKRIGPKFRWVKVV
jgi:transposase-like protein